jgi:hypothetical protein
MSPLAKPRIENVDARAPRTVRNASVYTFMAGLLASTIGMCGMNVLTERAASPASVMNFLSYTDSTTENSRKHLFPLRHLSGGHTPWFRMALAMLMLD